MANRRGDVTAVLLHNEVDSFCVSILDASTVLPADAAAAILVGRAWVPGNPAGPAVVLVRNGDVIDITPMVPTVSALLESNHPVQTVRNTKVTRIGSVDKLPVNSAVEARNLVKPCLLVPVDLRAVKTYGVPSLSAC